MPGIVSRVISDGQLEVFLEAIRIGKKEIEKAGNDGPKKSALAVDLRGLVRHGLEIPNVLRRHWESVLDSVAAGQIENYAKTGEELKKSFARGLEVLQGIEELVRSFESLGNSVPDSFPLRDAIQEIRQKEQEFRQFETNVLQHWPFFSNEAALEARAENERGESLDLEEAFAEIAGMDRDSWIKLVAKQKNKSA